MEDDLDMQVGWNQLFQHFISDLFSELDASKEAPVISIDKLQPEGLSIGNILQTLKKTIDFVRSKYSQEFVSNLHLSEISHLSVLSEGLALYLRSALSKPQFDALSNQISAAAEHWLYSIFQTKINSGAKKAIFNLNGQLGLISLIKIVFLSKYPNFDEQGYFAFKEKQPLIYYTNKKISKWLTQLSLPKSSLIHVQNADVFQAKLQSDLQNPSVEPLLVITHIGEGHHDDLIKFNNLSKENNLWIHVTGDDLALLLTKNQPDRIKAITEFDSFTVKPGDWYGLATPFTCTIVKEGIPHPAIKYAKEEMVALTFWIVLQFIGPNQLISILDQARYLASELSNGLRNNPSITSYSPPDSLTVIFRYSPITKPERLFHSDFLNNLTTQVLIDMGDVGSRLGLDITTLGQYSCIRFRPLHYPNLLSVTQQDMTSFTERLIRITNCINSTLSCSTTFEEVIQSCEGLHCVHVRNFVGIGAIRYLPPFFRGSELSPEVTEEINLLNQHLAEKLSEIDNLFSVGKTVEGQTCVCLGVETKEINNDTASSYAKLILDTMHSMDLYLKVQEKIEAIILKGIKEAENVIMQESEKVEAQKGIFRAIPLVSSVVNWWSPVQKNNSLGVSFDIASTSLKDASPAKHSNTIIPLEKNSNECERKELKPKALDFDEIPHEEPLPDEYFEEDKSRGHIVGSDENI